MLVHCKPVFLDSAYWDKTIYLCVNFIIIIIIIYSAKQSIRSPKLFPYNYFALSLSDSYLCYNRNDNNNNHDHNHQYNNQNNYNHSNNINSNCFLFSSLPVLRYITKTSYSFIFPVTGFNYDSVHYSTYSPLPG